MIKSLAKLGFVAALALPAMAQAVVVTPHAGYVSAGAFVTELISQASDTQFNSDIWFSVPASLAASASAAVSDANNGTITAHGDAAAAWTSATAGTVTMRNFGWDYTGGAIGNAQVNQGTNFEYFFTPTSNAVLTWNYDVRGTGYVFGLWGFQVYVDGIAYGVTIDPYNPNSYGTLTVNLSGGQSHHIDLGNNANIDAGGDISGYMDGDFSWTITGASVPEPASWAMLITGFGMIGGALRSRRRVAA